MDSTEIEISTEEWRQVVAQVVPRLDSDEFDPLGQLLLEVDGGEHRWIGTDSAEMAVFRIAGGPARSDGLELRSFRTMVPARLFMNQPPTEARLVIERDADTCQAILIAGGVMADLPCVESDYPDWRYLYDTALSGPGARLRLPTETLWRLVAPLFTVPNNGEAPETMSCELLVSDSRLFGIVWWEGSPPTRRSVTPLEVEGDGEVVVSLQRLWGLVRDLDGDMVEVFIPAEPGRPLTISGNGVVALLMPLDLMATARQRLEHLLRDWLGTDELHQDEDGDYPIRLPDGTRLFVRLDAGRQPMVRIFSVLAQEVPSSLELLEELNELNVSTPGVKAVHWRGSVMAEVELVAETLDPPELSTALWQVARTAQHYWPMLESYFGSRGDQTTGDSDIEDDVDTDTDDEE